MSNTPKFESEFLEALAVAFRKRLKSLRHRAIEVGYSKVYELVDGERQERLEIYLEHARLVSGVSFRFHARPDRQIWMSARKPLKRGIDWSWSMTGRLLGIYEGQEVVGAIEGMLSLFSQIERKNTSDLDTPWKKLLGRKPSEVR